MSKCVHVYRSDAHMKIDFRRTLTLIHSLNYQEIERDIKYSIE